MKKIYFTIFVLAFSANYMFAQCVIDNTNTAFFSPSPDSIPCIEKGVPFTQVIQVHVPATFDIGPFVNLPAGFIVLTVDSMQIDSITDFPTGFSYTLNPASGHLLGGENGCFYASGTTNDPVGNYPLNVYGYISVSGIPQGFGFPPDTSFPLSQAQSASGMSLSVDVINAGDPCRASGINSFSASLNSLLEVYPNPSSGVVNFSINTGRRLVGQIEIYNVSGQKVLSTEVDAVGRFETSFDLSDFNKGLYSLLLRTNEGLASKTISLE